MSKSNVVAIRMDEKTKKAIEQIAETEYRTFGSQCNLAIEEWLKLNENKKRTE